MIGIGFGHPQVSVCYCFYITFPFVCRSSLVFSLQLSPCLNGFVGDGGRGEIEAPGAVDNSYDMICQKSYQNSYQKPNALQKSPCDIKATYDLEAPWYLESHVMQKPQVIQKADVIQKTVWCRSPMRYKKLPNDFEALVIQNDAYALCGFRVMQKIRVMHKSS